MRRYCECGNRIVSKMRFAYGGKRWKYVNDGNHNECWGCYLKHSDAIRNDDEDEE